MPPNPPKRSRDWYSVSVASLLRLVIFGGLLILFFFSGFGFKQWERFTLKSQAAGTIEEATQLKRKLELDEGFDPQRTEYIAAADLLQKAHGTFDSKLFADALDLAERSKLNLESLLHIGQGSQGSIRFLSLQGTVEFRRGERGAWKRVRSKDRMNPGDWIKTSADGTAEIIFPDRSVYTLRQNTMVHLGSTNPGERSPGGRKQATDIVFGWVELNTSQNPSTVKTPKSETLINRESEALVAYDRERESARIAAFKGQVEVASTNGQKRKLGPLQQVEQKGDQLTDAVALPAKPRPLLPADKQEVALGGGDRIQLSWSAVPKARRYALQVSTSPLFSRNIIDVQDRQKTTATLGVRAGGAFFWQVAAIDRQGTQGPWSDPWTFRVAEERSVSEIDDKTPPTLDILEVQSYGSLVIVNGRVEPGATLAVNGEPVSPQVDGSFTKTVELTQEGWNFIEIVATDAWGNASRKRRRVFVDTV